LAEAKQEYSDVAGKHAVITLCTTHASYNKGQGATTKHFNTATMGFLEQNGLMKAQEENWFDHATNCELSVGFPPKNGVTPKLPSEVAQCL